MRRISSIYFLILALPATCAGLYPLSLVPDVLQMASRDERVRRHLELPLVVVSGVVLLGFIVGGLTLLPGYFNTAFGRNSVEPFFWKRVRNYNGALFAAAATGIILQFGLRPPLEFDLSFALGLGLIVGIPFLGFALAQICLRESLTENAITSAHAHAR